MTIWNKYKKIKAISSNGYINTYQAKIEPIIKEIQPKNKEEYDIILHNLKDYQNILLDLIEEDNKIYVVLLKNINLDKINILKEANIKDSGPISMKEINKLFNMEKAMCKIDTFNYEQNKSVQGSGFFIKINEELCGLLTNHHVIDNI